MVQTRRQRKLFKAASKVQQAYRNHVSVRSNVDPITLEHISRPFYKCVDPETNVVSYFAMNPFVDYLECTGDFRHPTTRRPLHPAQVFRLQQEAARAGRVTHVFDRMRELERRRKEDIQIQSTLDYFVERVEGMVDIALEICSTVDFTELER